MQSILSEVFSEVSLEKFEIISKVMAVTMSLKAWFTNSGTGIQILVNVHMYNLHCHQHQATYAMLELNIIITVPYFFKKIHQNINNFERSHQGIGGYKLCVVLHFV